MNFSYRNAPKFVPLSKEHREKRIKLATTWIEKSHPWIKTVFTDEKRFSLDGSIIGQHG